MKAVRLTCAAPVSGSVPEVVYLSCSTVAVAAVTTAVAVADALL